MRSTGMTSVIATILILGGLVVCSILGLSIYSYRAMFHPRIRSSEYCKNWGLEEGEYTEAIFALPWEELEIFSPYSQSVVRGHYLDPRTIPQGAQEYSPGKKSVPGLALFVHGITWTWYGMVKYMQGFLKEGWIVLSIDLPAHGASPQGRQVYPSYGYHEKYVVDDVVAWLKKRMENQKLPLVLVGESMGAATVLQYAPLAAPQGTSPEQWKVQAIIADCPYSSAAEELDARLKASHIPALLIPPIHWGVNVLLSVLRGYRLEDASPQDAIMQSPLPIMLVHGKEDTYVPTWMSEQMARRRKEAAVGPIELLIVPDAVHAKSAAVHPELWFPAVFRFLKDHLPGSLY